MVERNLVNHWMGMSKEEITEAWDTNQRERFDELMVSQQQQLEETIVKGIESRAKAGDVTAFEWLESRGLISGEGRRRDRAIMLEHIANRAMKGEMDAVEWLEKRGHIKLPDTNDS